MGRAPGSQWLSTDRDLGRSRVDATTLFRRTFVLPAGSNRMACLCVLADTKATVRLNGTVVIEQGSSDLANSHTPADCYAERTLLTPTLLRPGPNVLEFAVYNNGGPPGWTTGPTSIRDRPGRAAGRAPARRHDGRRHLPDGATVWFGPRALDTGEAGLCRPDVHPGTERGVPGRDDDGDLHGDRVSRHHVDGHLRRDRDVIESTAGPAVVGRGHRRRGRPVGCPVSCCHRDRRRHRDGDLLIGLGSRSRSGRRR